MADVHNAIPELEGEESLVVAVKQIMMALRSKKNLTEDTKKTLTELCIQLNTITISWIKENEVARISEIERRLNVFQEKIIHWETGHSMIWDSGLDESTEYLNVVSEAQKFTKSAEEDLLSGSFDMSSAMEEENRSAGTCDFSPVASHCRSDASILEWLSTFSLMGPVMEEENISEGTCDFSTAAFHAGSIASIPEWLSNGFPIRPAMEKESISGGTCDFSPAAVRFHAVAAIVECKLNDKAKLCKDASLLYILLMNNIHYMAEQIKNSELRHVFGDEWFRMCNSKWFRMCNSKFLQHVIYELRSIANLMFISGYGNEFSQAFVSVRRDALDECLLILEMEKLSIEDVLKLEWGSFNSKIKRWIRTMKIFVRVYLASEKWLTEQVFGELGIANLVSFAEVSKSSILQLLNFGDAVSIGPHKPEKLFPVLNMYEVLVDLLPDIESLYADEAGSCVRIEHREVLQRLGDSAKAAFLEFENAIATSTSKYPFAGCGIHPLTKYVMNYIRALTGYRETLNFLLKDQDGDGPVSFSSDTSSTIEEENPSGEPCEVCPMALHFRSIASILECTLDDKAKLYKDPSFQHIFLMNNVNYMAQKVKNSDIRFILGDEWIRKRNWKFQQHEMNYQRATWSSILAYLKDESNSNSNSNANTSSLSKSHLKERLRSFYLAFEKVYRTQTAWLIPDTDLREDLRISTSLKVIQAYRTFVRRHTNHISDKHIKYSADDLQNYLLDLFEGSQRSLHNPHKR